MDATSTTTVPQSPGAPARWQVPLFVVGLVAFLAAAAAHAYRPADPNRRCLQRDLAQVRRLLAEPQPDFDDLVARLEALGPRLEGYPTERTVHTLLLGLTRLRRADKLHDPDPERLAARQLLEEAEEQGVAEEDATLLMFALGKVWFHTDCEPGRMLDYLARGVDGGADDPAEGYGLLAEAHLRLPQPNLAAALEAATRVLQLPRGNDERTETARFLRGDLLLRLGRNAEAREALQRVRAPAPATLILRAIELRANSHQSDEQWAEAALLWHDLLTREPTGPDAARRRYFLGVCYRKLDRLEDAEQTWQLASTMDGGAGRAAALALADLRLLGDRPDTALPLLERLSLQAAPPASTFTPADPARERDVFERACTLFLEAGRHDEALRAARAYARLAPLDRAQERLAWALALAASVLEASGATTEARKFHTEGAEAALAAAQATRGEAKGDLLWFAAQHAAQAGDAARSLATLERYLAEKPPETRLNEVWFAIGEARRALGQPAAAVAEAHETALRHRGPREYLARTRLGQLQLEQQQVDQALATLRRNLDALPVSGEEEARETTLLLLAEIHHQRGDHGAAADKFEQLLARFPASTSAIRARYLLAACQRNQALNQVPDRASDQLRESAVQRRIALLREAVRNYRLVRDALATRQQQGALSSDEVWFLGRSAIGVAECLAEAGDYEAARKEYEQVALGGAGGPLALHALAGVHTCYSRSGQSQEAAKVRDRVREALVRTDFRQPWGGGGREAWEAWLREQDEAARNLR